MLNEIGFFVESPEGPVLVLADNAEKQKLTVVPLSPNALELALTFIVIGKVNPRAREDIEELLTASFRAGAEFGAKRRDLVEAWMVPRGNVLPLRQPPTR